MHAETVRIHGFVDGKGEAHVCCDLVLLAARDAGAIVEMCDWRIEEKEQIELLYDCNIIKHPKPLAEFVPVGGVTMPKAGNRIGDQKPPECPAPAGGCR